MEPNAIRIVFQEGPIPHEMVVAETTRAATNQHIGAFNIFLGQVRNDEIGGKSVCAIDYTAYREMAEEALTKLCAEIFSSYQLQQLVLYHSLGLVGAGQASLLVLTAATHRKEAIESCKVLIDRLKAEIPIWGKELFEDQSFFWKKNTP